ncbi:hypothetical protein DSO57_1003548 [Entomophthora muscae]|uniref:Uncharacterized protein n=2 Tax=Entomophthora muscae TaxID=34485 RepID=A0ACC2RZJ5_9FUNG|nr:hypothetical protein DSO57_1003548 [Entomophthora muscae]
MAIKRKRPPCPNCGSKRSRPTGLGTFICSRGHVLAGIVEESTNDGFEETRYQQHRRRQALRIKASTKSKIQIFGGDEAKLGFIKAFQFILRGQVKFLINTCGVPTELEAVVRKLWGFYLEFNPKLQINWDKINGPTVEEPSLQIPDHDMASDSESDDLDSCSSQASTDLSEDEPSAIKPLTHRLENFTLRWTLVFLYLGCQYIRCPILAGDILHLAALNKLPYLNAYSLIPKELQFIDAMPLRLAAKLPNLRQFHRSTRLMQRMLKSRYDVSVPPPAFPIIACRLLEHFRLPARLYLIMKNMARDADINLSNCHERTPESTVAALLAIAFKYIYGLNGRSRQLHPTFSDLPSLEGMLASMELANQRAKCEIIPSDSSELLRFIWARPNFVSSILGDAFKRPLDKKTGASEAIVSFTGLTEDFISNIQDISLQVSPEVGSSLQISSLSARGEHTLNYHLETFPYNQSPEVCLLAKHIAMHFLDGDCTLLLYSICAIEKRLICCNHKA